MPIFAQDVGVRGERSHYHGASAPRERSVSGTGKRLQEGRSVTGIEEMFVDIGGREQRRNETGIGDKRPTATKCDPEQQQQSEAMCVNKVLSLKLFCRLVSVYDIDVHFQ